MSAALNPEAYRQEYLKKLYKMLSPKGENDPLAIFAKYSAGQLPKAALKSFVRQAQLERGNKAAKQAELDVMQKELTPAPEESNQGNWGVWAPSLDRYATIGNSGPRRFLRHDDAQAWIQDYNARNSGSELELSVREIVPTTAPAAPESGSVQWNIVADDGDVVHTFYNRNVQADANAAALAWVQANWQQPLNMAARGPFEVVPAAIPGSTQDLQRQRMAAASMAADAAPSAANHLRNAAMSNFTNPPYYPPPTPIPGVQDIDIDVPMAQTQWEVYNRSSNQPVFVMRAADQAEAWRKGQEWVATAMQTDPAVEASNFSVRQSAEPVTEGLNELANTSLKVKEPKNFVSVNDRKQTTYKIFKFKAGKDTYLVNFTVKGAPAFGKKSNWNAVNVAFGVREEQNDYTFGDEIDTDLTAKNKNQFLIYSTVINTIRKFITEYNTEIDEIIMQGAGERQVMMYQRFFRVAPKYFPGWHYDGKHSLVRDVPRHTGKKVKEQDLAESQEITKLHKLDSVLERCIDMIHCGQESDPEKYGRVAACLIDNNNNHTYAINLPGPNGTRRHAERVAIDTHLKRHGRIGSNAIMVTTLSPCVNHMAERDGESCTELLSDYGIEKCYAGWQDPTQQPKTAYPFNLQVTDNADIFNTCQNIAASFLPQNMTNNLDEAINPDCFDPAFNDTQIFDGLTYRATVEEEYGKPVLTIKVLDDFRDAGFAKFKQSKNAKGEPAVVSLITSFRPEYQGRGIARNIYAYVRMLGNTIVPSRNQLPPGKAMWAAWKKSGDAKHLMKDVAEAINPDVLDPRFNHKQKIGDYTYIAGLEPDGWADEDLFVIRCYDGEKMIGQARFYTTFGDSLVSALTTVEPEYQKQGIASTMYAYARMLGNTIEPSASQLPSGKKMWKAWKKSGDAKHLMKDVAEEEEPTRIKINNNDAARAFIERVYARYPHTMQNNHVMVWGSGDDQQFAMFELIPSFSKRGAVEVKWIQAYPLRQGVGTRAMKELQAMAREDGISLTLFPWDKGQVSQSKLTKFYKGQGFTPTVKGGKAMQWAPK
jgi:GNAT superfamily N-acetyltransferase/pyrimidine deaminase RibD-like protein